MESSRFLECLAADAARLREVAARDLAAPVPSCPGWTVTDLVRHTAEVYLHKTETMRRGAWPSPWPPDLSAEGPLAAFDRAYAELTAEFAGRKPDDPSLTWFGPDQTVGFWIRRMAQETVIHRVDAELALGAEPAPIATDLAVDGVDEVLVAFLSYGTTEWAAEFGDQLSSADGSAVQVSAGPESWLVTLAPGGVEVARGPAGEVAGTVAGAPDEVLLWLWRRAGVDAVAVSGDAMAIDRLRGLMEGATQ